MKILLTERFLRAIKPTGKRHVFWDTTVPGFCVIVTPTGKIWLAVMRRLPGERVPRTWRLGRYPIMSLAEGRAAALAALRDIAAGIDPGKKLKRPKRVAWPTPLPWLRKISSRGMRANFAPAPRPRRRSGGN